MSADVERYQKEKLELEQRLASRDELSSTASTLQDKHNDQEWKVLEARLKVNSNLCLSVFLCSVLHINNLICRYIPVKFGNEYIGMKGLTKHFLLLVFVNNLICRYIPVKYGNEYIGMKGLTKHFLLLVFVNNLICR